MGMRAAYLCTARWLLMAWLALPATGFGTSIIPDRPAEVPLHVVPRGVQPEFESAVEALRQADFALARQLAGRYVAARPADPRAHLLLALSWVGAGQFGALDAHLVELDSRAPSIANAIRRDLALYLARQHRYYLAGQYLKGIPTAKSDAELLRLQAEILQRQGLLDPAITAWSAVLGSEPNSADALLELTRMHLMRSQFDQAAGYGKRLVQAAPKLSAGQVLLGTALLGAGQVPQAEAAFRAAVSLDPGASLAWYNLGLLQHARGDYGEAANSYRRLKATPAVEVFQALALAELGAGRIAPARAAMAEARKAVPGDALSALIDAAIEASAGNKAAVTARLRQASEIFPDLADPAHLAVVAQAEPTALLRLAVSNLMFRQGYFFLAAQVLAKVDDGEPVPLLLTVARTHWKRGDAVSALRIYEKIAARYPTLLSPVLEVADIAFHQGRLDAALKGYEKAAKARSSSLDLGLRLAALYNEVGRPRDAVKSYERLLASNPDEVRVLDQLASTWLEKLADPAAALPYAKRAITLRPGINSIRGTLIATQHALGDFAQVVTLFEGADRKALIDPQTAWLAGSAYMKTGRQSQAASTLESALNAGPVFPGYQNAESALRLLWRDEKSSL